MNVTKRLLVERCSYGRGGIEIALIPQLVGDDGTVVGGAGLRVVAGTEAALIALGVTHGRTDGEWGNAEVQAFVLALRETPTPTVPAGQEVPLQFPGYDGLFFADATGNTPLEH